MIKSNRDAICRIPIAFHQEIRENKYSRKYTCISSEGSHIFPNV